MRDSKGHFIKGSGSGNPSGRPKTHKISEEDRAHFKDDPLLAVEYLLSRVETRDELYKYLNAFMPYYRPKRSAIHQEINEYKEIRVTWEGEGQKEFKTINNTESYERLEDRSTEIGLTKDDLVGIMEKMSTKPSKKRKK